VNPAARSSERGAVRFALTAPRQPILGFEGPAGSRRWGRGSRDSSGHRVVASRDLDLGCHAEDVTMSEQGAIARIPDTPTEQDAVALCFGGTTAATRSKTHA
jgi:NADPH:quinone reductase-like Zn-dependent oxidoreductase